MKKLTMKFMALLYCTVFILGVLLCQIGSNAVTAIVETMPFYDRTVIVIDAGHGGIDGGATSCTGILESHTNLDIAMRLNDLVHLLGYETKMIRITDTSIYTEGNTIAAQKVSDLKNRVRIVNETDNSYLVSIHQNTFSNEKYSGAQVFYCENRESNALAKRMQAALIDALHPDVKRTAKLSKGIYLMEHIEKCGILIECGFISNPEEAVKLNDPTYQKKLCCVIGGILTQHISNT